MTTKGRMSMERSWKEEVKSMQQKGVDDVYLWIMAGERVAGIHNSGCAAQTDNIIFLPMLTSELEHLIRRFSKEALKVVDTVFLSCCPTAVSHGLANINKIRNSSCYSRFLTHVVPR